MKFLSLVIVIVVVGLLVNACKKEEPNVELNDQDRAFMLQASMINTRDILASRLAIDNTIDTVLLPFAHDMFMQDSIAQRDIVIMGDIVGNPVKDSITAADLAILNTIDTLTDSTFDSTYIHYRSRNYAAAMLIFDNEINTGRQPNVKAYANTHFNRMKLNKERADSIINAFYR